jgi:hypothetical protein
MLKKILLIAAAAGLVAATALPIQFTPASAATMTCRAAAKAKFPHDSKARHAYRKACHAASKAHH